MFILVVNSAKIYFLHPTKMFYKYKILMAIYEIEEPTMNILTLVILKKNASNKL